MIGLIYLTSVIDMSASVPQTVIRLMITQVLVAPSFMLGMMIQYASTTKLLWMRSALTK